ncbi:DNA-methyltransferase [Helicobacter cetorum]|uniref:DNA-methyltransferase n=1 Tax=Helicobacter cetorum TaxID=138563 RepID=UPI000CF01316|nr:site-specific DNA-methyltransferase [Helicobacter cetorum]
MIENKPYIDKIIQISFSYLEKVFTKDVFSTFLKDLEFLKSINDRQEVISKFTEIYCNYAKRNFQDKYCAVSKELMDFIVKQDDGVKIIWGDCLDVLKKIDSESIHLMVTSPPYYNARDYSQWSDLNEYLENMRLIIKESYRVLDNHRVFVFNVGDIFDNDNLTTKSTWGKRRIPLGAYFIKIFEEEGFTFVDDFIWDKGEVQSERHKNGDKPYPFYQYPMNCYEHILIFHKHRIDELRYPCPVCGTLKVNGNAYSEIGLKSWECRNLECFERSKSNRGKRFSLKTIMTQSRQKKQFEISKDFIKKWRKDIVKINPVIKINSKGKNILGHSAPFPYAIPEFAISMFSYEGDIVLDPFAGSFTSIIVAKTLKRVGLGIELNKDMFRESALENIKKILIE